MRLKNYLKEKYFKGTNVDSPWVDYVEFFENPSKREMLEVGKVGQELGGKMTIRFIADNKKKKVYVWTSAVMHNKAWKLLGGHGSYYGKGKLAGVAEYNRGNWEMISATSFVDKHLEDFRWVEKYIQVKDFLYGEQA